jgi:uncharacterized membrane protein
MNDILFMLHLLGFGAAFASAAGNAVILQLVTAAPADAPVLGKVPPRLARIGQIGLGFLWVTGLIMVWTKEGGAANLPWPFWVKLICVIAITGVVVMLSLLLRRVQAGDATARAQIPIYGRISGILLGLIVIFAVLAFH